MSLSLKKDIDSSFNKFFLMIEMLLDTYAPIQKLTKAKLKLKSKRWLTKGITTSIKKKNIKTQVKKNIYIYCFQTL